MFSSIFSRASCQEKYDELEHKNSQQLVTGRTIAAAIYHFHREPGEEYSCEFGSNEYFLLCGAAGVVACGPTHTMVCPLDIVKCRLQVNQERYKNVVFGFKLTLQEEGLKGLVRGWAPTFIGYSIQGAGKFGFYEYFKLKYAKLLGEEISYLHRTYIYLLASASAEFFADIGLSPLEAIKVRVQTSEDYGSTLREAAPRMIEEEGYFTFYKGIVPLWMRQIPYTMTKFTVFETTLEALYKYAVPKPRSQCSKPEQLLVTFSAGYIAGIFCAIVSHPADTVVSKLNKMPGSTPMEIFRSLGFFGMWHGLFLRIVMLGTLTASQWFIYDAFKVLTYMPRPPPPEMPESLKRKLQAEGKL